MGGKHVLSGNPLYPRVAYTIFLNARPKVPHLRSAGENVDRATLRGQNAERATLRGGKAKHANLRVVNAKRATFHGAPRRGASLRKGRRIILSP